MWKGSLLVLGLAGLMLGGCNSDPVMRDAGRAGVAADFVTIEPTGKALHFESAACEEVWRKLDQPLGDLDFEQAPIERILEQVAEKAHVEMTVNWQKFQEANLDRSTRCTLHLKGATASRVIAAIGGTTVNTGYTVEDGVCVVSTNDDLYGPQYVYSRMYDLRDIIAWALRDGYVEKAPNGSIFSQGASVEKVESEIISLITTSMEENTWRDNGGTAGSIRFFHGLMIVETKASTQREVRQMIAGIRFAMKNGPKEWASMKF